MDNTKQIGQVQNYFGSLEDQGIYALTQPNCYSKKDRPDSIPSPLPSVKIQIMDGKVCLRHKGKILLGVVNKRLKIKSLLTMPSNFWPLHLKQTFLPIF